MSDYCNCCETNVGHIREHYDRPGLTRGDERPEDVLAILRGCCTDTGDPCPVTLRDVENYIEELREEEQGERPACY